MTLPRDLGAVILAAGSGGRMGMPKIRLPLGGMTFVERVAATLADVDLPVVHCVIRKDDAAWLRTALPRVVPVVNPEPERGMVSSVACGLGSMPPRAGFFIVPVDHPLVSGSTYKALAAAFDGTLICKPSWRGRAGHPILIPGRFRDEIGSAKAGLTLAEILRDSNIPVTLVPCDDEGILKNFNTPADLPADRTPE